MLQCEVGFISVCSNMELCRSAGLFLLSGQYSDIFNASEYTIFVYVVLNDRFLIMSIV